MPVNYTTSHENVGLVLFVLSLIYKDFGARSRHHRQGLIIASHKILWDSITNTCLTWWRHQMETFSALLALCVGNSPVPVNSPHNGQWRGALMFSLICARINGWVNNREAGDLRRHRGHYDVNVMDTCLLHQIPYIIILVEFIGCICNIFRATPLALGILLFQWQWGRGGQKESLKCHELRRQY